MTGSVQSSRQLSVQLIALGLVQKPSDAGARIFFYSALTCSTEEINEDEHITDALATNRGDSGNFGIDSILCDEDFRLAARSYIGANACIKGQPNMTSKMFMEWIEKEYNIKIHESTARCWLQK